MIVTINGKTVDLPRGTTITQMLEQRGLNPNTVIIEYNEQLVNKEAWSGLELQEDDRVEILRFVGGG